MRGKKNKNNTSIVIHHLSIVVLTHANFIEDVGDLYISAAFSQLKSCVPATYHQVSSSTLLRRRRYTFFVYFINFLPLYRNSVLFPFRPSLRLVV